MITLEGGPFLMGTDGPEAIPGDGEAPVRELVAEPFAIDPYTVTVHRFQRFAEATGYLTDAEREGWSFVFAARLPDDFPPTRGLVTAPWWR